MKRFLGLAVAVVALAGLGAQTLAADTWTACEGDYAGYCKWGSCEKISSCVGDSPDCKSTGTSCEGSFNNCMTNSSSGTVYSDATCSTPKAQKPGVEACGGYCKWESGCYAIKTVPEVTADNPTILATCPEANASCLANSPSHTIYTDAACTQAGQSSNIKNCGSYCNWGTACSELHTVPEITPDDPTIIETCAEAEANCAYSPSGIVYSDPQCTTPKGGSSVKLLGSAAKTPGLKVSYAKNRVTVNWTPAAKISSGTIQLLNAKGVALSTSYIKANSGKVTAKLATVGVPAGMYFVHISAVGVNGQRIVSQSAVSVVK